MGAPAAPPQEFVVCVENADYPVSRELQKIYPTLPDEDALAAGDLRVVDESGKGYLFPAAAFVAVSLPERVRLSLRQCSVSSGSAATSCALVSCDSFAWPWSPEMKRYLETLGTRVTTWELPFEVAATLGL